jgi:hypothetical protein
MASQPLIRLPATHCQVVKTYMNVMQYACCSISPACFYRNFVMLTISQRSSVLIFQHSALSPPSCTGPALNLQIARCSRAPNSFVNELILMFSQLGSHVFKSNAVGSLVTALLDGDKQQFSHGHSFQSPRLGQSEPSDANGPANDGFVSIRNRNGSVFHSARLSSLSNSSHTDQLKAYCALHTIPAQSLHPIFPCLGVDVRPTPILPASLLRLDSLVHRCEPYSFTIHSGAVRRVCTRPAHLPRSNCCRCTCLVFPKHSNHSLDTPPARPPIRSLPRPSSV